MAGGRAGRGTNQEEVRRHNLGTLLRHVHRAGSLSRAELTQLMRLNRSTIAGLVGELDAHGVTVQTELDEPRTGAGRPSAGVGLDPGGPFVVAVDLGVDRVAVARVGLGGVVQERAQTALRPPEEAWQVGATVASLIRDVVRTASPDSPLVGIGVSVPGLVRRSDGLVRLAPNLGWHDVSFGSVVLAALGIDVPVSVANDADLGALAEHHRGAAVGIDDLVFVSGHVGVGAGVVSGGARLQGVSGYAGEVGHRTVTSAGLPCHCGNTGCWETEVGGYAIARAIGWPEGRVAELTEGLATYDGPTEPLRGVARHLGQGLAEIANVFNPELVLLGGAFRSLYPLVGDVVDAALTERALPAPRESLRIGLPALGADSALLGAAEIAFEPLLVDPVTALADAVLDVPVLLAG